MGAGVDGRLDRVLAFEGADAGAVDGDVERAAQSSMPAAFRVSRRVAANARLLRASAVNVPARLAGGQAGWASWVG